MSIHQTISEKEKCKEEVELSGSIGYADEQNIEIWYEIQQQHISIPVVEHERSDVQVLAAAQCEDELEQEWEKDRE